MALLFVAVAVVVFGGTGILRNVKYMPQMWDFSRERLTEASQTKDVDIYYQMFIGTQYEKMWKTVLKKELFIDQVIKKEV